jgi:hypothetical protein
MVLWSVTAKKSMPRALAAWSNSKGVIRPSEENEVWLCMSSLKPPEPDAVIRLGKSHRCGDACDRARPAGLRPRWRHVDRSPADRR